MPIIKLFDIDREDVKASMDGFPDELLHHRLKRTWDQKWPILITEKSFEWAGGRKPKNPKAEEYDNNHRFSFIHLF